MECIRVHASKEYSVMIGRNLLPELGQHISALMHPSKTVIVSDDHVWPLYGKIVLDALRQSGLAAEPYIIAAGEHSKNGENYLKLLNFLAERELTRCDCLLALGGGVVGDLTGFAAATYLRGIACIQIPTTLLAMVDSSVGGKTAIDLPAGKNLAGAFCQPSLVICDTQTLDSLPPAVFADGCAEVIKYGFIFDEALFLQLEREGSAFQREKVISECIRIKAGIVEKDEFDHGQRQLLNFGHTVGHAIEKACNYTISHGNAVAAGMAIVTRCSANSTLQRRLETLLLMFGLPISTTYSVDELCTAIQSDKKRSGDTITLILPAGIGCGRRETIPLSALRSFLKAGM